MTGEITLRGKILPVGGLKEKSLAALRADIHQVIIPEQNQKDLTELSPKVLRKLKFHMIKDIDQLLDLIFPSSEAKKTKGRVTKGKARKPSAGAK